MLVPQSSQLHTLPPLQVSPIYRGASSQSQASTSLLLPPFTPNDPRVQIEGLPSSTDESDEDQPAIRQSSSRARQSTVTASSSNAPRSVAVPAPHPSHVASVGSARPPSHVANVAQSSASTASLAQVARPAAATSAIEPRQPSVAAASGASARTSGGDTVTYSRSAQPSAGQSSAPRSSHSKPRSPHRS